MQTQRTALALMVFAGLSLPVSASVLNVPGNYPTIQAAINAASPGDTVLVANGTYSGAGNYNIDTLGKAITVKSVSGPAFTTVQCNNLGQGFVVQSGETSATIIDGFTITQASGSGLAVLNAGPSISNCKSKNANLVNSTSLVTNCAFTSTLTVTTGSPTMSGCTITGSTGNGIVVSNGWLTMNSCTISGSALSGLKGTSSSLWLTNSAFNGNARRGVDLAGGIFTATSCTFNGNVGSVGGGVKLANVSATFNACTIDGNNDKHNFAQGGGIYLLSSTATVTNSTISNNECGVVGNGYGGGVALDGASSATFIGTGIRANIAGHTSPNFAGGEGGGVYALGPVSYTNCSIDFNQGYYYGGGIHAEAKQTLNNCWITGNKVNGFDGGGISLAWWINMPSTVTDCVFEGNSSYLAAANAGGGAASANGAKFERCLFLVNTCEAGPNASSNGGAVSTRGGIIDNCIFVGNKNNKPGYAGAMEAVNDSVVNCTFYGNSVAGGQGQAMIAGYAAKITNCIFWGNAPGAPFVGFGNPAVTYCDIEGGYAGTGNINANPKFVFPGYDFRLLATSPCIDAGINAAIPLGVTVDFLSNARRLDDPYTLDTGSGTNPLVDMGAHEFIPSGPPCPWGPYNPNMVKPGDQFGGAVDVSGDTMVVGAYRNDGQGEDAGAAYVLRADGLGGWTPAGDLISPHTRAGDFFGISASIDGDVIAVGAPRNDDQGDNAGAVDIFRPQDGEWVYEDTLHAPDGAAGGQFGFSVAVSDDTILVGAWKAAHDGVPGAGEAYVFQYRDSHWEYVATLTAPDAHQGGAFGWSVDLRDGLAVVGAPGVLGDTGEACIFRPIAGGWIYEATLTAPDGVAGDKFGYSVAISGERAIVGSPWHDTPGMMDSGAAYLFTGSLGLWESEATLTGSVATEGANTGFSVALQGTRGAVGAPGVKGSTGAATVFDLGADHWEEATVVTADGGAPGDAFAGALALDGAALAAGAPFRDGPIGLDIGAAYLVSMNPCPQQCYADFNGDETLDLFDFLGYVNSFNAGEGRSDCTQDGAQDLFDFLCYVNAFNTGC